MSILTGPQIKEEIRKGRIIIDPYDERRVNPNSYNLCLMDELLVYKEVMDLDPSWPLRRSMSPFAACLQDGSGPDKVGFPFLDMKRDNPTEKLVFGEKGLILLPGVLYLAATIETAGADVFVPCVEGRSSVGRLGICVHVTAGFGDLNFSGPECPATWTLEITVVHPVRVYPGIEICQVVFTTPYQEEHLGPLPRYEGKYTGQKGPKASGLWKDFAQ